MSVNNSVMPLAGNSSFSYTFATTGTYNVGIGVVDVIDNIGSSTLSVTNVNLQPVPEPLTTLGSILAGGFGVIFKRKYLKKP